MGAIVLAASLGVFIAARRSGGSAPSIAAIGDGIIGAGISIVSPRGATGCRGLGSASRSRRCCSRSAATCEGISRVFTALEPLAGNGAAYRSTLDRGMADVAGWLSFGAIVAAFQLALWAVARRCADKVRA